MVDYKLYCSQPFFDFLEENMKYDVIIVGAGPGGIFSAYELAKEAPELKVAVFEA